MVPHSTLPPAFKLAVPDDALAPRTPRGTVLIFNCSARAAPELGVLVADRAGVRYVRRYAQGPGGTWLAEASTPGYITLKSDEHGLELLAVATGRLDGRV